MERVATQWWAGCCRPQTHSRLAALPLGLAHGWKVTRPVAAGELVRREDVAVDEANSAVRVRREMEQMFAAQPDIVVA